MKKILFILSMFIWVSSILAQAPQGINYQGVARNTFGAAISKQNISVQFTILQSGNTKYQENQTTQTDTFGLYSLVIGNPSATVTNGTFASIPWSSGNLSIQIGIDPTGGASYTTIATTQLESVPYALYAGSSGSSGSSITSVSSANVNNIVTTTSSNSVTVDLAPTSVVPNTYGSSTTVPSITVDQYGRVTGVVNMAIPSPSTQSLSIAGNTLSISGDNTVTLPTTTVAVTAPLSGDGSSSNPIATSTTIVAGMVGSATAIPVITYDMYGRITAVATQTISSGALPTPTVGSLLYSNSSNTWTATNPSNISSDGNSITVINTTTVGTAGTFSVNGAGSNSPALQVTSNSSTGYALKADNLSGAAIVANSTGPYTIEGNIVAGGGDAIVGEVENASSGHAVAGYIQTGSNGSAVYGNIDINSTGNAGNFTNTNPNNSSPGIFDSTNSTTGYSARFIGGKGLQTDQIQITGTAAAPPLAGYVLTSDALGNGTWQSASASSWLTTGNTAGAADFLGTNNAQPFIFKANGNEAMRIDPFSGSLGIGTTSPVAQLDVSGNIHTNAGKLLMGPVGGINQGYTGIYSPGSGTGSGDLVLSVFKGGASGGGLGSSNSYDAVTVQHNTGNVGIGTNNPGSALEVQGGSGTAGTFANGSGSSPALNVQNAGSSYALSVNNNGGGSAASITNTGSAPALVVNANAASGSPSAQFSGGTGLLTDNLTVGNGFHLSPNANPNYVLTSDATGNGTWQPQAGVTSIIPGTGITTTAVGGAVTVSANSGTNIWNANELQNVGISTTVPTTGQILQYNGTQWVPSPPPVVGASNGLMVNTGSVVLGGNLTNTTTISQGVNNMLFQSSSTGNVQISNANNTNGALAVTNTGTAGGNALNVTSNGTASAIQAQNNGTAGPAGYFSITTAGNTAPALYAVTTGTNGSAATFTNSAAGATSPALVVGTNGSGFGINVTSVAGTAINASNSGGNTISAQNTGTTGGAGNFQLSNTGNNTTALTASTDGLGNAAVFSVNNASNGNYALNASTNGTNAAIWATNTGSGAAIAASIPVGNSSPVVAATANGGGNSGKFTGGLGLYTDNITINTGAVTTGAVLTATNTTGGASWVLPAAPITFIADATTPQAFTASISTQVNFPTITVNAGGGSYAGNNYTAPTAGTYHIDAALSIPTSTITTTTGSISIAVNGAIVKTVDFVSPQLSSGVYISPHITADINITSPTTQPISIFLTTSNTGSSAGTAVTSWFNVHLVH